VKDELQYRKELVNRCLAKSKKELEKKSTQQLELYVWQQSNEDRSVTV